MWVMAKRIIPFPLPHQPDPDGPIKGAIFQIGDSRVIIDLRGPEPKVRTDPAEVISIGQMRKRTQGKDSILRGSWLAPLGANRDLL